MPIHQTRCMGHRAFVSDEFLLPDADALVGGEVEFVCGLNVEGGVPAVFIADG